MPVKQTTDLPLRRYSFIAGAATLLVVLVSWAAIRSAGPARSNDRTPMLIQPTVPLTVADPASLPHAIPLSSFPATAQPPATASASPTAGTVTKATTKPKPRKTAVTPTPTPARTTKPPKPAVTLAGHYTTGESWDQGFIGSVAVTNKAGAARNWTVKLTFAAGAGVRVGNTWNAQVTRQNNTYVFTGGPLAPGSSITMGFEASKQVKPRVQAATCTVNDGSCQVG